MVREKKLLLLSMMLLDEEMCNYVDRKTMEARVAEKKRGKRSLLHHFRELAVEDIPRFAEFLIPGFAEFFNFFPQGLHLERLIREAYGIANGTFLLVLAIL